MKVVLNCRWTDFPVYNWIETGREMSTERRNYNTSCSESLVKEGELLSVARSDPAAVFPNWASLLADASRV